MIETPRVRLRCWRESDRDTFAALHADPQVMADYGGPINRRTSDAKLDRYRAAFDQYGFCRWAIETRDGAFLGYAGPMPVQQDHPLGSHIDIGWRLVRTAWGGGYATEAAMAALQDAFARLGLDDILAYTSLDNARSQAVIRRLHMQREPARDFVINYPGIGAWHALVWTARKGNSVDAIPGKTGPGDA